MAIAVPPAPAQYDFLAYKFTIAGTSSSANVFAYLGNPFGIDVVVKRLIVRITTQSTGASTLDIGIGATSSTANDGLIDGASAATAGLLDNALAANAGTNGKPSQVWTADAYLTIKEASGDVDGLAATIFVEAVPA
jgi:hypothetical protein